MRKNPFALFLVISFVISAPFFAISTFQKSAGVIVLLFLLGSYAPALAAWIVIKLNNDHEERVAFRSVLWKWGNARMFLVALLTPSVIWSLAYVITISFGNNINASWLGLAGLPLILLVNYGEEAGWRGYALPYLLKRFDPFRASLILGVIWGLFHVALNWQRSLFALLTFFVTLLLSVVITWLFVNTKSILPGLFLHASFNAWTQVFVVENNFVVLAVCIVLLICFVAYLMVRHGRELIVGS